MDSSPVESTVAKAEFRKPSNDCGNRKYRRRSPVSGSSSSDGEPVRKRNSTPTPSRDEDAKISDDRQRKDDRRDIDKDHRRSRYSRDGDSYRNADRSSRSSYNHHRHEDYSRHEKYAEEDKKNSSKSSPRSRSGSGTGGHGDHAHRGPDHNRSRDTVGKYSRDKSDGSGHRSREKAREASSVEYLRYRDPSSDRGGSGRRQTKFDIEEVRAGEHDRNKRDGDGRDERKAKTSRDWKSECSPTFEESRSHRTGHDLKEVSSRNFKELEGPMETKDEKEKHYDQETSRRKERNGKEPKELLGDKTALGSNDQGSLAKKPKMFSLEKDADHSNDASKHVSAVGNDSQFSGSKQGPGFVGRENAVQEYVKESDIDAAKIAAMKAAELVNRNLIGTGYMSTDQKKKLLWGSKKSTATEETANRWDTSMFTDRERQEKFHKLMSLRLHWYLWPIVGCERRCEVGAEAGKPRQQSRREAKGTSAGLGKAVHCRSSSARWAYSWSRSVRILLQESCSVYSCCRARDICLLASTACHACCLFYCWIVGMLMRSMLLDVQSDAYCELFKMIGESNIVFLCRILVHMLTVVWVTIISLVKSLVVSDTSRLSIFITTTGLVSVAFLLASAALFFLKPKRDMFATNILKNLDHPTRILL